MFVLQCHLPVPQQAVQEQKGHNMKDSKLPGSPGDLLSIAKYVGQIPLKQS